MKRSLQARVLDAVVRHSMICSGDRIGIGVRRRGFSGASAPVSRATYATRSPAFRFAFPHQLRGADADADEMFVAALHGSLSLILCGPGRCSWRGATQRLEFEDAARRLRYQFFDSVASSNGSAASPSAHGE